MAIDRFSYVPESQKIDTYVPLPFPEMKEALQQKQLQHDDLQNKLDELPKYLQANIKSHYIDNTGTSYENAAYKKYVNDANILNSEIKKASEELNQHSDLSETRKITSQLANKIANWKNNEVKPLEEESANYDMTYKKLQDDKNRGLETYRSLDFDLSVRGQSQRDFTKGKPSTVGFSDQIDYSDITKRIRETAKDVPLSEAEKKGFKKYAVDGINGFLKWESENVNNAKQIQQAIQPIIQEHQSHILTEFAHNLSNNPEIQQDMISKGYNPNDKNSIIQYGQDYSTTIKVNNKEVKSNLLKDFYNQKRMELTQSALGFTKAKNNTGSDFDIGPEWMNKGFGEETINDNNGYVPTASIDTDIVENKYDSGKLKNLSFNDYIEGQGIKLGQKEEAIKDGGFAAGKVGTRFITSYNKEGKQMSDKEVSDMRKQYNLVKDIDKLKDNDFVSQMSSVNPIAKAILGQLGSNISKKDLLDRLKLVENQKNLSGVAINLREKEADNQWYSLFGKQDQGSFNNAKSLTWTDRNTGETLNFDSIEIDGTKVKDLDPDEIIKYKKEGRIGIPKFEYPIASKGGQTVEIDGKTYVTGGETFKEKAELKPMSTINTVLRKPLETANNNGYGEVYNYKSNEIDPYISKRYGINPKSIQGYTDYKTLQNYVIVYDNSNNIIGKLSLDEYNKGIIKEVGSGFVQPKTVKGLD